VIEIVEVSSPGEVEAVRALFREYRQAVGVDLWFGSAFQRELDSLPEPYAAPSGRLLLAREGDELAGCAAVRALAPGTVEVRRVWVRRAFRKRGVARQLIEALLAWARQAGFATARLEVLSVMRQADVLFRGMGFAPIPDDRQNPFPESVLLARKL
jgi:putative acetyltransferase